MTYRPDCRRGRRAQEVGLFVTTLKLEEEGASISWAELEARAPRTAAAAAAALAVRWGSGSFWSDQGYGGAIA